MSEPEQPRGTRRPLRRRLRRALFAGGGIAAAGVLAFVGTGIASALTAGSGYRTALVERAAVSESVQTSGTVAAVSRYDLVFQTDGTVATVDVALGDTVSAGQTLATLDRDALEDAVAEAEEALSSAEQTLAEHAEAQASGTTAETSSPTGTPAAMLPVAAVPVAAVVAVVQQGVATIIGGTAADGSTAAGTADVEAAVLRVTDAQQAMLAAHRETQALLEATNSTIAAADDACAPFLGALLRDPEGDDAGVDAGVEAGMTLEQAQQALADCQGAIIAVRDGQAGGSAGQQEVQDLAAALDAAVVELQRVLADEGSGADTGGADAGGAGPGGPDTGGAGAGGESPGDAGAGTGAGSGSGEGTTLPGAGSIPDTGSTGGGSGAASGGTTITAEQLLADQAAIDAAEARLRIAEAQLAFSALTSPIDGTVAAMEIAAGDSVAAGSATAAVTVIGEDGYVVETTIPLTNIAKLAVEQEVEAVVNASGETYPGAVSSIGLLDVSSTSTPAYTVIVALEAGDDELLVGGSARLDIRTAATEDALTVPTSAVHRDGVTATVDVMSGGEVESVDVDLGAIGSERTEILSGLEEGQAVVLADLSLEISGDGDDDSGAGGLAGLGGSNDERSLPGGGFPGGGFPGGGDLQPPAGGFGG
ncbi:HlyD family efflux transporter periplasmic adaptor subunit [Leucobacter celer]|uniref:HlyD family efflux transporter periplasmic adaptor subunit n=1 Tax=Leucobacter celer TaxID=668625 RepID=UPI0006A7A422|nr:HlyD family efflux transporter periplasmic adaptor subunit [Leucobacter celer]